ncbi:unnamed protein product [Rotaria socialis]|uniref:Phosphatidic acid phosphatase type 2/haloperoxidase domain-containing protein n=1 Tax=Rotaria socialis TaxID=392032 RepID=A0A817S9N9_9BILA|nr:unnamed protein product [Rotaria socialis]
MYRYNQIDRALSGINQENHDKKETEQPSSDLYPNKKTTRKRYVLEKYPPSRQTPAYNPLNYSFRPITPPYFDKNGYERPRANHPDNERRQINLPTRDRQIQHTTGFQKKVESSPISEVNFAMDKIGGNTRRSKDLEVEIRPKRSRRRQLLNNLFDVLAIAATAIIFGLIYSLAKPSSRGFFCDDTSIRYPIKPDTIPMWLLGVYGGLGPVIIFCIVEIWVVRPFECGSRSSSNNIKRRRIDYLKTILQTIFLFGLGIAICFLITEVGKRTIGRLRPYYLTLCDPNWANIECTKIILSFSGPVSVPQYITNHNCNATVLEKDLREARLSFPSGHASYSTFAFVFLFVYFEARLVCPQVQFLKPFLQCICIAIAFYTCLSRVIDFKHHPTDVIGGAIVGLCIAIFAAVRVGTYLWSFGVYCETVDETKKDRLPQDERVPIPGIERKQNGVSRGNDQIQLETIQGYRQQPITNSFYNSRPYNDNSISMTEPRSASNGTFNGVRRVSPSQEFHGPNN